MRPERPLGVGQNMSVYPRPFRPGHLHREIHLEDFRLLRADEAIRRTVLLLKRSRSLMFIGEVPIACGQITNHVSKQFLLLLQYIATPAYPRYVYQLIRSTAPL